MSGTQRDGQDAAAGASPARAAFGEALADPVVRDVVVVGGGAAGLNAALMLARSRRSVTVIDAGQQRNGAADGVHGLLGLEGIPPGELLARGRREVVSYGGEVRDGEVTAVEALDVSSDPDADVADTASGTAAPGTGPADVTVGATGLAAGPARFAVTLADGSRLRARRLVIATGLVDELPDVPGVRERWGRDVLHCPYCHGWEVRDRAIVVFANGPVLTHQAMLFRQLSDRVTLLTFDHEVGADDAATLAATGITVVDDAVEAIEVADDRVVGVRIAGGAVIDADAVVVASRLIARLGPFGELGLTVAHHPMGEYVEADETGRTSVEGVWVAGNVTDLAAQVGAAAASGALAGAHVNADLVMEEAKRATARASAIA
ncbi:oxidoreductase [Pseudoclavibacter endophyticus]|uniref:NAD(P)/FAD-dependent oxidoreductase n=1 Tax=Pseudoclavibacter endophyticus TaxID=1778590 RepID=A0A6H9WP18_9MICO|nr:NAD(P)/FAD-dependent oxidoreductase [Pseudoclavibacter endophyticus]KAB1648366.1 NAD(P)/FAD-dependent oxidoreductase [Pseudoclavibacter endophyticus]GGA72055.1 oxidoreductase [Pseudoclavibacter endophyticus]